MIMESADPALPHRLFKSYLFGEGAEGAAEVLELRPG